MSFLQPSQQLACRLVCALADAVDLAVILWRWTFRKDARVLAEDLA